MIKRKKVSKKIKSKKRKNPGEWDDEDGTIPELDVFNVLETKERILRYLNKTRIQYSGENHESWMLSFIEKLKKEIIEINDENDVDNIVTTFMAKIEVMRNILNIIRYESVNDDWYPNKLNKMYDD